MSDLIENIAYVLLTILIGAITLASIGGVIYLAYLLINLAPITTIVLGCIVCFFVGWTVIENSM